MMFGCPSLYKATISTFVDISPKLTKNGSMEQTIQAAPHNFPQSDYFNNQGTREYKHLWFPQIFSLHRNQSTDKHRLENVGKLLTFT